MIDKSDELKPAADDVPSGNTESQGGPQGGFFSTVKTYWRLIFTLVLLFLIAFMYQWKTVAVNNIKEDMKVEKKRLTERVSQVVEDKNKALVRLAAIPLSWAVRTEMVRENFENIDQYFRQLVREDRFRSIALANLDGKIIVATDKRLEGEMVAKVYSPALMEQFETTVNTLENGELMAAAPVLGLTGKLGMLVMIYAPESVNLEPANKR